MYKTCQFVCKESYTPFDYQASRPIEGAKNEHLFGFNKKLFTPGINFGMKPAFLSPIPITATALLHQNHSRQAMYFKCIQHTLMIKS